MLTEIDDLKKELAEVKLANQQAKAENQQLQLRLNNALLALKMEMNASGTLVKVSKPNKIVGRH